MENSPLIKFDVLADEFGLSDKPRSRQNWIKQNKFPIVKINNEKYVHKKHFDQWCDENVSRGGDDE